MSQLKQFVVHKASSDDYEEVISFLKELAQWMKDNEINQWSYLLEGGDDEEIKRAIQQKHTYKVLSDDMMIATFTLSPEQSEWDQHIFGKEEASDSLYLHRLAVRPQYMNQGIGKEILRWIHENLGDGKQFIKLDCVADNVKLNQFYRDHGFEYLGETDNHSKYIKHLSRR
ncbi:GNAT family N-acetyltransferase [Fictibacillus sp. b24]|uniref:GNAT family N-acetyltransferase n=1 Tax=Fictibacillus sp. b24 TaxID=3055863 RepID=UPI0025A28236|nr:GNAT family N-acetyltransferase [Fictibacillus sp. b24]MDM5317097.1 GNAT family N-acetyltransferase [Fictibacillus sp. b24]